MIIDRKVRNETTFFPSMTMSGNIRELRFEKEVICLKCSSDRSKEVDSFKDIEDAVYFSFKYRNGYMIIIGTYHEKECGICEYESLWQKR